MPPHAGTRGPKKEIPIRKPYGRASSGNAADPVAQTSTPAPGTSQSLGQWEAMGAGYPGFTVTAVPPDPNIAVGPNHIVQWVNNAFVVFDKQGHEVQAPVDDGTFWGLFSTCNQLGGFSDPIVQYDRMADRWLIGEVAIPLLPGLIGQFAQCFAVSTTPDPTGSYSMWAYGFGTDINDYPKISVWPDGYYVTWNIFQGSGAFLGPEACAFDRSAMLAGAAAPALVCFKLNGAFASLLPSDLDGAALPPPGSPNFFMNVDPASGVLNEWKFHVDFVDPKSSTFSGPIVLSAAPFTSPCLDTQDCIPQPGTTTKLDALGDRLMNRLAYRNLGDHASIVANHTVLAPAGNAAVRWYEVRDPDGSATIFQQGTFAPDTDNRWMGSIAMDQTGNIGVGYSVASDVTYPSIRFTGWEVGNPLGTFQPETFAVVGGGSQTAFDRWGDYSAMRIDPSDDCTFWYTQEYQATTQEANWNTRIVSFRFPSCGSSLTPTMTSLTATPNPSTPGQTVVFTATVSPTAATGTVQFFDGSTSLGSATLGSGTASLSTSALAAGAHAITAIYGGDGIYASSSSAVLTETVNSLIGTTTSLTSSPNPATFGQSVVFTAAVVASSGTNSPTGSVAFRDGTTLLGSSALDGTGTATFSTSNLAVGTHVLVSQYSGDTTFSASSSSALSQTINRAATTTTLTSSPNPSTAGQPVTFTAALSPSTATGTVQFFDGSTSLGTAAVGNGTASLSTSSFAAGSHAVTAVYSGDGNFLTSTSFAIVQTVIATSIGTSTSLISSPNPSMFGQTILFTATVVPASGTTAPTGTVSFLDGTTLLAASPLNASGVATLSTSALAVGTHSITAQYSGDGTYSASASPALSQTVNKAQTTITLTSSRNPANPGQPVTFRASISPTVATGTVQFFDGAVLLGSGVVSSGGATLTTSNLSQGSHAITAQYGGDGSYAASTSAVLTQTVGRKK